MTRKEPHITEFTAKRGSGVHIRVTTTRDGKRIGIDGGRLYYADFVSKRECMRTAKEIRDRILRDIDIRPVVTAPTVGNLFEKSYDLFPVAHTTRTAHQHIYDHWIADYAKIPIDRLKLQDVQMTVNRYAETHEQNRLKRIVLIWKRIYKTAFFSQVSVVDLSQMIVPPKSKVILKERDMSLDMNEFDRMVECLSGSRYWKSEIAMNLIWIMYYTGMRTTEVLALSRDDIDLDRRLIHVRHAIGATHDGMFDIVPLKTKTSRRDVPIADGLMPVLESLIDNAEDLLFTDPEGEVIPSVVMTQYVSLTAFRQGIKFSLYRLRHAFSADLFRSGTNPKVIQTLLGHESENMSLYYAYTTESERLDAVNKRKPS